MASRMTLRSFFAQTNRLLGKQRWLKATVRSTLGRLAPEQLARLQGLSRQSAAMTHLDTGWTPRAPHALSDLHPALSSADLATLERPDGLCADYMHKLASPSNDLLEPVLELGQMRQSVTTVCFVLAIDGRDAARLDRTLQSVLRQTDPGWEVLLCCGDEHAVLVAPWLDIDWRIRRFVRGTPVTEAHDLRSASVQSTTQFVGLLSVGDILDDDLVKVIGEKVRSEPDADMIYTDEATLLADQRVGRPFYKPDWSPEYQQAVNMLGRFVAVRKALLLQTAAPTSPVAQVAEYDLLLRLSGGARAVAHIDDPLYIRGISALSPLGGFFAADALPGAGEALAREVRKESKDAQVDNGGLAGSLHVRWPVGPATPVTLLILSGMHKRTLPGQGEVTLVTHFVRSILEMSTARGYRIIVVDDGVVDDELRELLAQHGHGTRTCPKSEPFSFAHKANFATSLVDSGIVLLLNDDLEVVSPDWIQELAGQAARPKVGVVGCRLLFGDGTLQHAGIALGHGGTVGHVFHAAASDGSEYAGMASVSRNWSAVTGAVMAYRKEVFDEVGGFDPALRTDYNDVDFCLKCQGHGYRVVYTPAATLYHFHNSSFKRKHDSSPEREAFLGRWSALVRRDPFFSKNFQSQSAGEPLVSVQ